MLACAAALYRMPLLLVQVGTPATRIRELPVRHKYRRPPSHQAAVKQLDLFGLPGAKHPTPVCTPAPVTIMPEKEWPTRTVGPSCRASTRSAEATASGSVVSGFCTEVTLRPPVCNRAITSDQQEPSANSPCTSTTLRACSGVAFAAMPRVEI